MAHRIARLVETLRVKDRDAATQTLVEDILADVTAAIDSREKIILVVNDYNHFKVALLEAVRAVPSAVGTPAVTNAPVAVKK